MARPNLNVNVASVLLSFVVAVVGICFLCCNADDVMLLPVPAVNFDEELPFDGADVLLAPVNGPQKRAQVAVDIAAIVAVSLSVVVAFAGFLFLFTAVVVVNVVLAVKRELTVFSAIETGQFHVNNYVTAL